MGAVLAAFSSFMPNRVALAGPTLIGELPRGSNDRDALCDGKGEYVYMNARGSKKHSVILLRTRDAFFRHLPSNWIHPCCFLTVDGEHHNANGAAIVASMFTDRLRSFYV